MDKEIRREIILDNYKNTTKRGKGDSNYIVKNTKSDSCIDNIDMALNIQNGIVKDALFDGEACAICTSASNILAKMVTGKTIDEAKYIIENYQNMINEEEYDESVLGELLAYEDLYLQPSRKNCGLLPSKAIKKIINEVK